MNVGGSYVVAGLILGSCRKSVFFVILLVFFSLSVGKQYGQLEAFIINQFQQDDGVVFVRYYAITPMAAKRSQRSP